MDKVLQEYLQSLMKEKDYLIARFILEKQCEPSDVLLVERETKTGRVFYPDLKSNYFKETKNEN